LPGRYMPIEELEMFSQIEAVADEIWGMVAKWDFFAKDTTGKQLVRAADSIGANLVEGDGCHHHRDSLNFFHNARAAARETKYFLARCSKRKLILQQTGDRLTLEIDSILRQINAIIRTRREWFVTVKEPEAEYTV